MNEPLIDYLEESTEIVEEKERFKVTNLETANWVFKKLTALDAKLEEINKLADGEIKRITEWQKKKTEQIETDIDYFENLLISYYMEERNKDKRFKLSTPYGKVSSKTSTKYSYDDEKLLEELSDSEYINIKKSVNKNKLKADIEILEDGRVATCGGVILEGMTSYVETDYKVKAAEV